MSCPFQTCQHKPLAFGKQPGMGGFGADAHLTDSCQVKLVKQRKGSVIQQGPALNNSELLSHVLPHTNLDPDY